MKYIYSCGDRFECLPMMYNWRFVDLPNAFQYPISQFLPGADANVAKESSGHFAKQCFNDVEPRAVGRSVYVFEAIGPRG